MKKFTLFFTAIFLFISHDVVAHEGHKKEPASIVMEEEPSTMDPMYANEGKEPNPLEKSDLFSPSDLFIEGEIVPADPAENTEMQMENSHNDLSEHLMPKVEKAKHKMVDKSAKGYGMAIGITLFVGLIFAGLTFIRPEE